MSDARQVHLGQPLDPVTLESIADFVCGDQADRFPIYRSGSNIARFFQDLGISVAHDGTTRKWWALEVLKSLSPQDLEKVILRLVDLREYKAEKDKLKIAMVSMNDILAIDNFGAALDGALPILIRANPIQLDEEEILKRPVPVEEEAEFLQREFGDDVDVSGLGLDPQLTAILQERIEEAMLCRRSGAPLATVFLLGSSLEGLLLAVAIRKATVFVAASAAPKDKEEKVLPLHQWSLNSLIDVAYEVGVIDADVKKFSHALRGFRNYVHPYQQLQQNFSPTQHTADICGQVFRAAVAQIRIAGG